jgi:hypothetical protein
MIKCLLKSQISVMYKIIFYLLKFKNKMFLYFEERIKYIINDKFIHISTLTNINLSLEIISNLFFINSIY